MIKAWLLRHLPPVLRRRLAQMGAQIWPDAAPVALDGGHCLATVPDGAGVRHLCFRFHCDEAQLLGRPCSVDCSVHDCRSRRRAQADHPYRGRPAAVEWIYIRTACANGRAPLPSAGKPPPLTRSLFDWLAPRTMTQTLASLADIVGVSEDLLARVRAAVGTEVERLACWPRLVTARRSAGLVLAVDGKFFDDNIHATVTDLLGGGLVAIVAGRPIDVVPDLLAPLLGLRGSDGRPLLRGVITDGESGLPEALTRLFEPLPEDQRPAIGGDVPHVLRRINACHIAVAKRLSKADREARDGKDGEKSRGKDGEKGRAKGIHKILRTRAKRRTPPQEALVRGMLDLEPTLAISDAYREQGLALLDGGDPVAMERDLKEWLQSSPREVRSAYRSLRAPLQKRLPELVATAAVRSELPPELWPCISTNRNESYHHRLDQIVAAAEGRLKAKTVIQMMLFRYGLTEAGRAAACADAADAFFRQYREMVDG